MMPLFIAAKQPVTTLLFELPESLMHLVLILGILLILISLMMSMKKRRNKSASRVTAHEHLDRLKNKHAVKNDLETLMVEIEELGKRLSHQIDAKTIALERLLDEAELRITQLSSLTSPENPAPAPAKPSIFQSQMENSTANPTATHPVQAASTPPVTTKQMAKTDFIRIYQLADAGNSPQQIAQEVGEHIGKIELILALRKQK